MAKRMRLKPLYRGKGSGFPIHILYDDHHYDCIVSMSGFLEHSYYCDHCDVGYEHVEDHRCSQHCTHCLAPGACIPDKTIKPIECAVCQGVFTSVQCYENHLKPHSSTATTTPCQLMTRCPTCHVWMSKKQLTLHSGSCNEKKEKTCPHCKQVVDLDHRCFVQQMPSQETSSTPPITFSMILNALRIAENTNLIYVLLIAYVPSAHLMIGVNSVNQWKIIV